MGNLLSYPMENIVRPINQIIQKKRKRDTSDAEIEDDESLSAIKNLLHTPKRRKLTSTAQYIFNTLFKEGINSDVTVNALGKSWKLHKVYLSQSPYFASMFSGSWKETFEDAISLKLDDPDVNLKSLEIVFGSMYLDEVTFDPSDIVATLATANLFQLESLIDQCIGIMIETINYETANKYYESSIKYCINSVEEMTFKWLLVNLCTQLVDKPNQMRELGPDLLTKLIGHPDLIVVQTEFTLYNILRYWLFLQMQSSWEKPMRKITEIDEYFEKLNDDEMPYLLTKEGEQFASPFKSLRLQHLVYHHLDFERISRDNIIPLDWFTVHIRNHWNHMLRCDQGIDKGPTKMKFEEFSAIALRCGRTITAYKDTIWRWTGFNFGLDLIWSFDGRNINVRRNQQNEQGSLSSLVANRKILLRVTVFTLDKQKQIKNTQASTLLSLNLKKNQEQHLLFLKKEIFVPFIISVNLLVTSPCNDIKKIPKSLIEENNSSQESDQST